MVREKGDHDVEKSENQDVGRRWTHGPEPRLEPMGPLKWNQRQKPRLFSLTGKMQMFNSASC